MLFRWSEIIVLKNILSAVSFYKSAIHLKGWERQWTIFTSNAKYGDTLHPHASKKSVHLPNYILSHTNRCTTDSMPVTVNDIWNNFILIFDSRSHVILKGKKNVQIVEQNNFGFPILD